MIDMSKWQDIARQNISVRPQTAGRLAGKIAKMVKRKTKLQIMMRKKRKTQKLQIQHNLVYIWCYC